QLHAPQQLANLGAQLLQGMGREPGHGGAPPAGVVVMGSGRPVPCLSAFTSRRSSRSSCRALINGKVIRKPTKCFAIELEVRSSMRPDFTATAHQAWNA